MRKRDFSFICFWILAFLQAVPAQSDIGLTYQIQPLLPRFFETMTCNFVGLEFGHSIPDHTSVTFAISTNIPYIGGPYDDTSRYQSRTYDLEPSFRFTPVNKSRLKINLSPGLTVLASHWE